jgi:hypothetical protein
VAPAKAVASRISQANNGTAQPHQGVLAAFTTAF